MDRYLELGEKLFLLLEAGFCLVGQICRRTCLASILKMVAGVDLVLLLVSSVESLCRRSFRLPIEYPLARKWKSLKRNLFGIKHKLKLVTLSRKHTDKSCFTAVVGH